MTDIGEEIVTCAVCGRQTPQTILFSTSTFGAPDLDLRPPPMKRQTIEYWVQECPYCGYVASNISEADSRTRRFLQGDGWKAVNTPPPEKAVASDYGLKPDRSAFGRLRSH
jgi:hypothetical protein